MEAELGSDKEENDHIVKSISENNDEDDENINNDLEDLINDELNEEEIENVIYIFIFFSAKLYKKNGNFYNAFFITL